MYCNIFALLIIDSTNLSFLNLINKLGSFLKFVKNSITPIISHIFIFRANYTISKSAI